MHCFLECEYKVSDIAPFLFVYLLHLLVYLEHSEKILGRGGVEERRSGDKRYAYEWGSFFGVVTFPLLPRGGKLVH